MTSLSAVIPVYNEEAIIEETAFTVDKYLSSMFPEYEIIIVDSGSEDKTFQICGELAGKLTKLRVLQSMPYHGKGAAVREGMRSAKCDIVLFLDADLSTPIREIEKTLPFIKQDYDIVIGSRTMEESRLIKPQRPHRQTMGKIFNRLVRLLFLMDIKDTQCGFKVFSNKAAKLLSGSQRINGFAFDVEILLIARNAGMKIAQVGIDWENREASKVRVFSSSAEMLRDLFVILLNNMSGKYS